ncbi:hypothetical protein Tco_0906588 [Tanacetum coccineum]|uniref:Uncharacterized protein n=1 Tax=Tanacetum coccineum TaxID=301880 RepID=A0ABQ5CJ79_9ASTR
MGKIYKYEWRLLVCGWRLQSKERGGIEVVEKAKKCFMETDGEKRKHFGLHFEHIRKGKAKENGKEKVDRGNSKVRRQRCLERKKSREDTTNKKSSQEKKRADGEFTRGLLFNDKDVQGIDREGLGSTLENM